jgi:hypothetical protein
MTRLQKPWPANRTVNPNGRYGNRVHPISGQIRFHTGLDVGGTFPVTAAADGTVVHIGWNPRGGGHTVVINHGDIHTAYFHGRERTTLRVGQKVKAGDFVYTSGATGVATGPHLHFEVRRTRNQATHVDPTPYLEKAQGPTPTSPLFIPVTGVMDAKTWSSWQILLLRDWGYQGRIDGVPGTLTNQAIQRSVRPYGYMGPISGNLGPQTRRAVQRRLNVKPDGVWGRMTITRLQERLNAGEY